MPVTVTFTPTKWDVIRAGYLGLRTRSFNFALLLGLLVILPWLAALRYSVAYFLGESVNLSSIMVLVVVPVISIAFFALLPLVLFRGARTLNGPHVYEFAEGGIRLTGPGFDNRVEWKVVTRCYGFKQGLLFVSGRAPLVSVPARSLSPVKRKQLRELIMASGVELAGHWRNEHATPETI